MKRAPAACALGLLLAWSGGCRDREPRIAAPAPPLRSPTPLPVLGFLDEAGTGSPRDGGVLQRRLVGEPTTLNAVLQSSAPEAEVLQYVQRNLFDFDARLELVPSLAEAMFVSGDGRDY